MLPIELPFGTQGYVIEVTPLLQRYHLDSEICSLFPKLTLEGFITLCANIEPGPGWRDDLFHYVEKVTGELFEVIDLDHLTKVAEDICNYFYIQLAHGSMQRSPHAPLFWKWIGVESIMFINHHDHKQQNIIKSCSRSSVEAYLHASYFRQNEPIFRF